MGYIVTKIAGGALRVVKRVRIWNGASWDEVSHVVGKLTGGALINHHTTIILTNSTPDNVINLFTAAGSPSERVTCILYNTSDIYSTNIANAAFDTGTGWAAGSKLYLYNSGGIYAMGGDGGDGGDPTCPSTCGAAGASEAGGDAINLQHDLEVFNNGTIFGGAGGGGGGGSGIYTGGSNTGYGGGGGGGGARYITGGGGTGGAAVSCGTDKSGTSGEGGAKSYGGGGGLHAGIAGVGNRTFVGGTPDDGLAGTSGGGGAGGFFAMAGGDGGNGGATPSNKTCGSNGTSGGAAGKAIEPDGNGLTLTNTGTIYGATA